MSGQQGQRTVAPPLKVILGLSMGQINVRESDVPPRGSTAIRPNLAGLAGFFVIFSKTTALGEIAPTDCPSFSEAHGAPNQPETPVRQRG